MHYHVRWVMQPVTVMIRTHQQYQQTLRNRGNRGGSNFSRRGDEQKPPPISITTDDKTI